MKLYHCPYSRSVRVRWVLEELQLRYELEEFEFSHENLNRPEYLALNPLGKVPTFVDGDLTMFESGAIVEYLVERYGEGRLAPPPGTSERGIYLQWLHFAEASMMVPIGELIAALVFTPEERREPAAIEASREKYRRYLAVVEQALETGPFLLGEVFTAADAMMGYTLFLADFVKVLDDSTPNVRKYYERLRKRSAYKRAMAPIRSKEAS